MVSADRSYFANMRNFDTQTCMEGFANHFQWVILRLGEKNQSNFKKPNVGTLVYRKPQELSGASPRIKAEGKEAENSK